MTGLSHKRHLIFIRLGKATIGELRLISITAEITLDQCRYALITPKVSHRP